jgi:hypothetical protein
LKHFTKRASMYLKWKPDLQLEIHAHSLMQSCDNAWKDVEQPKMDIEQRKILETAIESCRLSVNVPYTLH